MSYWKASKSCLLLIGLYRGVVSLAYKTNLTTRGEGIWQRLVMKVKKRTGPRTEPRGSRKNRNKFGGRAVDQHTLVPILLQKQKQQQQQRQQQQETNKQTHTQKTNKHTNKQKQSLTTNAKITTFWRRSLWEFYQ